MLFWRNGAPPSLERLVERARKMCLDFHTHLKKFEYARSRPLADPEIGVKHGAAMLRGFAQSIWCITTCECQWDFIAEQARLREPMGSTSS